MPAPPATIRLTMGHPDADRGPERWVFWIIALTATSLITLLAWAAWARLDVSVRARGSVVSPSHLQQVTSVDGGFVQEMLVQVGQRVTRGQLLARLDSTQASADLGELQQNQFAASLAVVRLDALLTGVEPKFPPPLQAQAPALAQRERQLWADAVASLRAASTAANEAVAVRAAELAEMRVRAEQSREALRLAQEAMAIEDRLHAEGAGSRADHLASQQRLQRQDAELQSLRASIPRLEAALAEARANASEVIARQRAQWSAQRAEQAGRAAAMDSAQAGREDRVRRRELVAPLDGVVNRIHVPTRGGVALPGKPVVDIVPDDTRTQLQVQVAPQDIGFVRVGQRASVQVLAYDSAQFGRIEGEVERVGADALTTDRGETYFEVQVLSKQRAVQHGSAQWPISTGMTVEVGILTGERTVLQYLLKPVMRGLGTALQER